MPDHHAPRVDAESKTADWSVSYTPYDVAYAKWINDHYAWEHAQNAYAVAHAAWVTNGSTGTEPTAPTGAEPVEPTNPDTYIDAHGSWAPFLQPCGIDEEIPVLYHVVHVTRPAYGGNSTSATSITCGGGRADISDPLAKSDIIEKARTAMGEMTVWSPCSSGIESVEDDNYAKLEVAWPTARDVAGEHWVDGHLVEPPPWPANDEVIYTRMDISPFSKNGTATVQSIHYKVGIPELLKSSYYHLAWDVVFYPQDWLDWKATKDARDLWQKWHDQVISDHEDWVTASTAWAGHDAWVALRAAYWAALTVWSAKLTAWQAWDNGVISSRGDEPEFPGPSPDNAATGPEPTDPGPEPPTSYGETEPETPGEASTAPSVVKSEWEWTAAEAHNTWMAAHKTWQDAQNAYAVAHATWVTNGSTGTAPTSPTDAEPEEPDSDYSDWFTMEPSSVPGETHIRNMAAVSYRCRFGTKPVYYGLRYIPTTAPDTSTDGSLSFPSGGGTAKQTFGAATPISPSTTPPPGTVHFPSLGSGFDLSFPTIGHVSLTFPTLSSVGKLSYFELGSNVEVSFPNIDSNGWHVNFPSAAWGGSIDFPSFGAAGSLSFPDLGGGGLSFPSMSGGSLSFPDMGGGFSLDFP